MKSQLQSPWQREPEVGVELFTRDRPPQYHPDQWNQRNWAIRLRCLGPEVRFWDTCSSAAGYFLLKGILSLGCFITEHSKYTIIATCMVFGVDHRSQWAKCVGLDLYSTVHGFLCVSIMWVKLLSIENMHFFIYGCIYCIHMSVCMNVCMYFVQFKKCLWNLPGENDENTVVRVAHMHQGRFIISLFHIYACIYRRDHCHCKVKSCTYWETWWMDCMAGMLFYRSAVINRGVFRPPVEARQGGM